MPPTPKRTYEARIIGGIYAKGENADKTVEALVVRLDDLQAKEAYTDAVCKAIRSGNILVPVDTTTSPAPVIEAIDDPHGQLCRLVLVEWPKWMAQPVVSPLGAC